MTWDLIGHEWAANLLKEHLRQRSFRHAYLFTGPQGAGRRTLALRFAQALNCPQAPEPGEACRACRTCRQIEAMAHPDLALIQGEEVGGGIKVEQVRELQRQLALSPYDALYRVAILLRFETASDSAANALLKTLEEPPPQVVLLLTAESSERLLPTIVSRCEVLRLRPVPAETIARGLQERWDLPAEQAQFLAHLSGGRPGFAIQLHQQPEFLAQRSTLLADHQALLAATRLERFAYAYKNYQDKEKLRLAIEVWTSLWRDVLLLAAGATAPLTNLDQVKEIERLSTGFGPDVARRMVAALQRTSSLLDHYVNARLALEVLLMDLPTSA